MKRRQSWLRRSPELKRFQFRLSSRLRCKAPLTVEIDGGWLSHSIVIGIGVQR